MINDLKDFEKFLKICRKQGVTDVAFNGVTVKLGSLPGRSDDSEEIHTDGLTDEQFADYYIREALNQ